MLQKEDTKSNHYYLLTSGQNNMIICYIFYALYINLKSRLLMQCSGTILKIATDLHLVLILLCQVRLFATQRLVKEDNGRPVQRIYSTGTIGWQNSAVDLRKFYDIKLDFSMENLLCLTLLLVATKIDRRSLISMVYTMTELRNFPL